MERNAGQDSASEEENTKLLVRQEEQQLRVSDVDQDMVESKTSGRAGQTARQWSKPSGGHAKGQSRAKDKTWLREKAGQGMTGQTRPDQTRPDQTRPDQGQGRARQGKTGQARPGQGRGRAGQGSLHLTDRAKISHRYSVLVS